MTTYINPGNNTGLYGIDDININVPYGNANVETFLATGSDTGGNVVGNIVSSGNVTANYYFGDGSLLTGIASNYGNAQVAAYLASGTVTSNIVTTGNVSGTYVLGNGSQLTGLPEIYGNANVATYLASGTNTANMITTGNVSGTYILGNGSQLTGLPEIYGNANVATLLAGFGSNSISTTGNVTAGFFTGDGSQLSNINAGNITGAYGNANVTTLLGSFGSNNIVTTGNITGGNIKSGNITIGTDTIKSANSTMTLDPASDGVSGLVVVAGNLQVTGTTTTVDSTVVTINDLMLNVANNAATSSEANGGGLGVGPVGSEYVKLYWDAAGNTWDSTHGISAVGTVTAGQFTGSGAGLTAIPGANVSGTVPLATSATTAGTVTTAAQPNITSVGTLTSVSATGNIAGNYFIGNGSLLTGVTTPTPAAIQNGFSTVSIPTANGAIVMRVGTVPDSPNVVSVWANGNVNMTESLTVIGAITSSSTIRGTQISATGNILGSLAVSAAGNITGGNIITGGLITATGNITGGNINTANLVKAGNISATGNIDAVYAVNALEVRSGSVTTLGLVDVGGELEVAGNISAPLSRISGGNLSASGLGVGFITASANISAGGNVIAAANIVAAGKITAGGVIQAGGEINSPYFATTGSNGAVSTAVLSASGNITALGNISGNYYIGNGSLLTGITATVTPGGSDSQIQYNNGGALGGNALMTFNDTTGNIALANVKIAGTQIENTSAYATPTTAVNPGRLVVGNGYAGDISTTYDFFSRTRNAHLAVWNSNYMDNVPGQSTGLTVQQHMVPNATMTNNQARALGISSVLQVGGQDTYNWTQTLPFAINAVGSAVVIGNGGNALVGNTAVTVATGSGGGVTVNPGSSIGNALGFLSSHIASGGAMSTAIGFTTYNQWSTGGTIGETIQIYGPNGNGAYNTAQPAQFRQATNGYWFLKNDDDVATNKMGSLKQYHEFAYTLATSGTLDINKTNGQVQTLAPSANMFIGSFSNFVTNPSNGATNIPQADTVTVIITQGATGYSVGLPAAGANIKYAGGTSTVGTTANSVTMVSITAINAGGSPLYLVTVSPEFV